MLKIKDKKGRTTFQLRDEDEGPVSVDALILDESKSKEEKVEEVEVTEETDEEKKDD